MESAAANPCLAVGIGAYIAHLLFAVSYFSLLLNVPMAARQGYNIESRGHDSKCELPGYSLNS
jgi:hypothetical protein